MRARRRLTTKYFIGVDEAGRGPIAGPVAVGVVVIPITFSSDFFKGIYDSKELSEREREYWVEKTDALSAKGDLHYAVGFASSEEIDTQGIVPSVTEALARALSAVKARPSLSCMFLDGSLFGPTRYLHRKTSVRGDVFEPVIALASIVAKVNRDRLMTELSLEHPGYGFEKHKGYGTKDHYQAIRDLGLCPEHRKSFIKLSLDS